MFIFPLKVVEYFDLIGPPERDHKLMSVVTVLSLLITAQIYIRRFIFRQSVAYDPEDRMALPSDMSVEGTYPVPRALRMGDALGQ